LKTILLWSEKEKKKILNEREKNEGAIIISKNNTKMGQEFASMLFIFLDLLAFFLRGWYVFVPYACAGRKS